jgi:uncharacterized protein with HEPN domain
MSNEIVDVILETILDSINITEGRFTKITQPDDFVLSEEGVTLLDAISMRLQVIGEQIKKLEKAAPELIQAHPEIEWKQVMKLRDLISHHYDQIDNAIVYDICKNHLPKLKRAIQSMLRIDKT